MAHLAYAPDAKAPEDRATAEFGVSVLTQARGRGYGARLFDRAMLHARNRGCSRLFIHALSENNAMLKIAANAGATVQRDGPESAAWLQLPPTIWSPGSTSWSGSMLRNSISVSKFTPGA